MDDFKCLEAGIIVPTLDDTYLDNAEHIREYYENKFHNQVDFFVKVPGRVNIIGEHLDYNGYGVLPMAIPNNITLAVGDSNNSLLNVSNMDSLKFPDQSGDIITFSRNQNIDTPVAWHEYMHCGAIGGAVACGNAQARARIEPKKAFDSVAGEKTRAEILNVITSDSPENCHSFENEGCNPENVATAVLNEVTPDMHAIKGVNACVLGTIPLAAGLSSSSALVCAAALAIAHNNNVRPTKLEMAELCAKSERLIGTAGGGMDQAIAFTAQEGFLSHITFNPVGVRSVRFPDNVGVFVICHSLVQAEKANTNDFNMRVQECRTAAMMLLHDHGKLTMKTQIQGLTLASVAKMLKCDLQQMLEKVKKLPLYKNSDGPRKRATHVYSEAIRLEEFIRICEDKNTNDADKFVALSTLMNNSHESLKTDYNCSHAEVDILVKLCQLFGAGARVTGAGWGGCVVALCPHAKVEELKDMLTQCYYSKRPSYTSADGKPISPIFTAVPSKGAAVYVSRTSKTRIA